MEHKYERLEKALIFLKEEYFNAGDEWIETRDSNTFHELNGLLEAINWLEIYLYDKKITSLLDIS